MPKPKAKKGKKKAKLRNQGSPLSDYKPSDNKSIQMAKFEETKSESLNQLVNVDQLVKDKPNQENNIEHLNISSDFAADQSVTASLPATLDPTQNVVPPGVQAKKWKVMKHLLGATLAVNKQNHQKPQTPPSINVEQ